VRCIGIIGVGVFVADAALADGLVLWNQMGSASEVQNSEVGPGGTIVGSNYAFEPGRHGDGYIRKATGPEYVEFPSELLQNLSYRGTLELWVNPRVPAPVPYDYGFFGLVGNSSVNPSHRNNIYLYWGDGVTGQGFYAGIHFDGNHVRTPDEPEQFVATPGVPILATVCWDIDGIDGTDDTLRVYRDGAIVGASTGLWNPEGTSFEDRFRLGTGPDAGNYDKWVSDNLKVWDYAETRFPPARFTDPGWVPEPASLVLAGLLAGVMRWRGRKG
jgi:hypothetical protein